MCSGTPELAAGRRRSLLRKDGPMEKRTQIRSTRLLAWALAGHFVMGAGLGALLAAVLLLGGPSEISQMTVNSADPAHTELVFVGTLTLSLAIGATLTGLIFTLQDRE
jgi:hypothetical protein